VVHRLSETTRLTFVNGTYQTIPIDRSLLVRTFPGACFYTNFARIVCRGARNASRGAYGDEDWSSSSLEVLRALEAVGVQLKITGTDRFSHLHGPCVFIGNHMSSLDAFVLPTIIQPLKRVTFIVKRSLVEYPIFGHIMRSRDPIVVGRTNPREDLRAVLEGGLERLRLGISIVVFPQTTRTATFDPVAFNSIGIKLAKRAQVPVIPQAQKTDARGNGKYLKDFGKIDPAKAVHFAFGLPLHVQGSGAAEHQQVVEFIREHLVLLGGKVAQSPISAAD
jgi:1-acyl-sn-glycerol-3-phosphate acyltransferase